MQLNNHNNIYYNHAIKSHSKCKTPHIQWSNSQRHNNTTSLFIISYTHLHNYNIPLAKRRPPSFGPIYHRHNAKLHNYTNRKQIQIQTISGHKPGTEVRTRRSFQKTILFSGPAQLWGSASFRSAITAFTMKVIAVSLSCRNGTADMTS